jgi:hypothetical protein
MMGTAQRQEPNVYIDRRSATRFEVPACATCAGSIVAVVLRTSLVLYLRCVSCGCVWNVPKPVGGGTGRPR